MLIAKTNALISVYIFRLCSAFFFFFFFLGGGGGRGNTVISILFFVFVVAFFSFLSMKSYILTYAGEMIIGWACFRSPVSVLSHDTQLLYFRANQTLWLLSFSSACFFFFLFFFLSFFLFFLFGVGELYSLSDCLSVLCLFVFCVFFVFCFFFLLLHFFFSFLRIKDNSYESLNTIFSRLFQ